MGYVETDVQSSICPEQISKDGQSDGLSGDYWVVVVVVWVRSSITSGHCWVKLSIFWLRIAVCCARGARRFGVDAVQGEASGTEQV